MKTRYRIVDKNERMIFCNLNDSDARIISELQTSSKKFLSGKVRAGVVDNEKYMVYAFTESKDYIKSSSIFKTELNVILNSASILKEIIEESSKKQNKNTSRLIHNLTSINAHNIQEFYSLVPQECVSQKKMDEQLKYVQSVIKKDPKEAATALLKMAKNNTAMKVEFSVFKKLFDSTPHLQPRTHNVHKVLMNIFYLFFSDFTDKEVQVNVGDKDTYSAYFDYESIQVALYHVIENAAKYTKPSSTMEVKLSNHQGKIKICFEMISIQIQQDEIDTIFNEGFSGDIAKKTGKSGDGIGMSMAKQLIELNQGSLSVEPCLDSVENVMGITYQKNVFSMLLPIKNKRKRF